MKKHEIIKKTDLLSGLDDQNIKTVAEIAVENKYPKNTILFNEGDSTTSLYIILIGKIDIPEHILLKPGKLTEEEFNIIKPIRPLVQESFQTQNQNY